MAYWARHHLSFRKRLESLTALWDTLAFVIRIHERVRRGKHKSKTELLVEKKSLKLRIAIIKVKAITTVNQTRYISKGAKENLQRRGPIDKNLNAASNWLKERRETLDQSKSAEQKF